MVLGIGTDIVDVRRIAAVLERQGDAFIRRILTPREQLLVAELDIQAPFVAKRFAAKEAVAKALGTGFQQGLSWQHIEVSNNDLGKPELCLVAEAEKRFQYLGAEQIHLSLADERHYALAYVIIS